MINKKELPALISLLLGAKFIYRTADILRPHYSRGRKLPCQGQVLTIVGFRPRWFNDVVVRESNGAQSLMPLYLVKKALELNSRPGDADEFNRFREIRIPVSPSGDS